MQRQRQHGVARCASLLCCSWTAAQCEEEKKLKRKKTNGNVSIRLINRIASPSHRFAFMAYTVHRQTQLVRNVIFSLIYIQLILRLWNRSYRMAFIHSLLLWIERSQNQTTRIVQRAIFGVRFLRPNFNDASRVASMLLYIHISKMA